MKDFKVGDFIISTEGKILNSGNVDSSFQTSIREVMGVFEHHLVLQEINSDYNSIFSHQTIEDFHFEIAPPEMVELIRRK